MNWYLIFYLFSVADALKDITQALGVVLSTMLTLLFIIFVVNELSIYEASRKERQPIIRKWAFLLIPSWIFVWIICAMLPSKKDMVLIIAGGSIGQFVTTDTNARALPMEVTKYFRTAITKETENLQLSDELKQQLGVMTRKDSLAKMSKEELIKLIDGK